jgi:hypothetical protein
LTVKFKLPRVFVYSPTQDTIEPVLTANKQLDSRQFEKIERKFGLAPGYLQGELVRRPKLIRHMIDNNITDMESIARLVDRYTRNPSSLQELLESTAFREVGSEAEIPIMMRSVYKNRGGKDWMGLVHRVLLTHGVVAKTEEEIDRGLVRVYRYWKSQRALCAE